MTDVIKVKIKSMIHLDRFKIINVTFYCKSVNTLAILIDLKIFVVIFNLQKHDFLSFIQTDAYAL